MLRPPTYAERMRIRAGIGMRRGDDWHIFERQVPPDPNTMPFPKSGYNYAQALRRARRRADHVGIVVLARAVRLFDREDDRPDRGEWRWAQPIVMHARWFDPHRDLPPHSPLLHDPSTWWD